MRVLIWHSASVLGGLHFPGTLTFPSDFSLSLQGTLLVLRQNLCRKSCFHQELKCSKTQFPWDALLLTEPPRGRDVVSEPSPDPLLAKPCSFPLNMLLCQEGFSTPGFAHAGRICTILGGYAICLNMRQVRMTSTFTKFLAALRKSGNQCIASPRCSQKYENRGMSLGCVLCS